jgi:NTE family protein
MLLVAAVCAGCAAPLQRPPARPASSPAPAPAPAVAAGLGRPSVGVAFGGGSARGIAHVGVIRWLEEHRIPIDAAAGTSMGGLIGGAFASGMDAGELATFIESLDWDQLFGASSFGHKNIRRKADARAYPSRLEFGLRGGIVPPTALNDGEYVELLLERIAAPYYGLPDFDHLPTPFRTVAVDLLSAQQVVMRDGSLAEAMRATMSLPLVFPPVELNGGVLIDGGTMNNIPADVVKAMGAGRVIAVNVGEITDREAVAFTMFGVAGETIDAMMRASTRRSLAAADVVINVPLKAYGSLAWRRADELIEEGYKAAEAMRDQLLPLAVSEADYEAWRRARQGRRLSELPVPAYVQLEGFADRDTRRLNQLLGRHVGQPLDVAAVENDIAVMTGLDRYQTVTWRLVQDPERGVGLAVRGRVKPYAPPFMMLGVNLENTTSSDFRMTATARYLAFDVLGSGTELRIDGTIGSDPSAGIEWYRPLGASPLFVAPYAGVARATFDFVRDDEVVARYQQNVARAGVAVGVNLGARSDVRLGTYIGRTTASIQVGNPDFPELRGKETGADLTWRLDTQDSPVIPSRGILSQVRLSRVFNGPDIAVGPDTIPAENGLTQLSGALSEFWTVGAGHRLFVYGGLGTSFDTDPLPTDQFEVGRPFRLGAYDTGEVRGSHFYLATAGYLRRIGRLPDFMGGPVFAGGWVENGDAFDQWSRATLRTNSSVGVIADTILGPVVLAGSWSYDGRWRTYLGIGRIFR